MREIKRRDEIGRVQSNPNNTDSHRQCGYCGEIKELTLVNFSKNKNHKFGFEFGCKVCVNRNKKKTYKKSSEVSEKIRVERKSKRTVSQT